MDLVGQQRGVMRGALVIAERMVHSEQREFEDRRTHRAERRGALEQRQPFGRAAREGEPQAVSDERPSCHKD